MAVNSREWPLMAVNGGHAGTKKGPNWGHVFFSYGWSLLLTVKGLGLFYLRLRFGLVFFAYGGKSVWSFLLTVPPVRKLGLVFFAYGSPTVSKKDEP